MSKILYIGSKVTHPKDGADQVNMRNQFLLERLFEGFVTYLPPSTRTSNSLLQKLYLGISDPFVNEVLSELETGHYKYLFISHSTLGRLAGKVKKKHPEVKIMTFYHNIEVQYAQEYLSTTGLKALPFYLAVKCWEKQACLYSDYNITLNQRDSNLLRTIYGKKSHLELPTSFQDRFCEEKRVELTSNCKESIDYLFVGVSFFANIHGIQWFIDNVMPRVCGHLYIIGKGMDSVAFNNLNDRIHIHGFVNDLAYYYYNAKCVVSPIFVGGGMKTKTAEALMYGKIIIGTDEAFEGYVLDESCMLVCNSADDFVETLCLKDNKCVFNKSARRLFKTYYSIEASLKLMTQFFENMNK